MSELEVLNSSGGESGRSRKVRLVAIGIAVAFALVLWGGYGHHWSWTGINGGTATLWDWLHLLLLPLAVSILPIWLSAKTRVPRRYKSLSAAGLAVFAVIVIAGYGIPWAWTGFVGNKLWDWLNLLALPIAVALLPLYGEIRARWQARHTAVATGGLVVFVAIVLGGYLAPWGWTGFTGNTFWDWLHLVLVPILLPAVVVPYMVPLATSGLEVVAQPGGPGSATAPGPLPATPPTPPGATPPPAAVSPEAAGPQSPGRDPATG
jgi:hypothetical protein